jgi:hypothetical protein
MNPVIYYYYYAGCQRRRLRARREAELAKQEQEKLPVESSSGKSALRNLSEENRRCGPNSKKF